MYICKKDSCTVDEDITDLDLVNNVQDFAGCVTDLEVPFDGNVSTSGNVWC